MSKASECVVSPDCEEKYVSDAIGAAFDVQQITQQFGKDSADLALIVDAWPLLPGDVKAAVVRLIANSGYAPQNALTQPTEAGVIDVFV